ncbi:MAG: 16S rRNA (adenine(1518)-N(6)/adenine(1519)-N(6))-dimethyltransferase RsmA [Candidatus Ratteibacteria bacterium]|nr:16S rRNA (adenine(1518)-N(6)/adenine(1519)-N(6))-dimethyltransferase RsmA [Candidatus Ratteibacteria bacterium]
MFDKFFTPLEKISKAVANGDSMTSTVSPGREDFLTGLTSLRVLKEILAAQSLRLKKRLGQNFLVDRNILNKILESAGLKSDDLVIEIGAGLGTLTQVIAPRVEKVWAIEIDRGLVKGLKERLGSFSNAEVIHGDALKIEFSGLIRRDFGRINSDLIKRIKIIGNIPYSLTSPLVRKILEEEPDFRRIWLLLPEDVAGRMKASPGTKTYGAFSVLVNFYAEVRVIRKIPPQAFFPIPKVASRLVKLERHKEAKFKPGDKNLFFEVVRASFEKRRKKLSNAIKPVLEKRGLDFSEIQKGCQIDLNRRGETLSLDEFVELADCIAKHIFAE